MNYHSLSRRELQALCKEHKIPANKTNVFMADALTALLGALVSKNEDVLDAPLFPVAPTESVGEEPSDTSADDAEEPAVAVPVAKKAAKGRPSKKASTAVAPEDACSAVKPPTKRAPVRSKVASLAALTAVESTEVSDQPAIVDEDAKPVPVMMVFTVMKNTAGKANNAKTSTKVCSPPQSPKAGSSASGVTEQELGPEETDCVVESVPVPEPVAVIETKEAIKPAGKRTKRLAKNAGLKKAVKGAEIEDEVGAVSVKAIVSQIEENGGAGPEEGGPGADKETEIGANVSDVNLKDVGNTGHGHISPAFEVPSAEEHDETEVPKVVAKRAGRAKKAAPAAKAKVTKAKAGKTKAAPLPASPPAIEVYCDVQIEKEAEVVDAPSVPEPCDEPSSPSFGDLLNSSSPAKCPSLAHMEESGSESEVEEPTPVVQNVKRGGRVQKNADEKVDKENAKKLNVADFPQSLRKLRKELKEAFKKKGNTPTASPLKDISLNVQSPRAVDQSPTFSFQF